MNLFNKCEKLAEKFNELDSDLERIGFLKKHRNLFVVQLDNDHSHVIFATPSNCDEDEESLIQDIHLESFDDFFGNDTGVFTLFEALGIEAESV